MSRRFCLDRLSAGIARLDAEQSRHARNVLRMNVGDTAELFDPAGNQASGRITCLRPDVLLAVENVVAATPRELSLVIASAIPKGNRADWMVEKLSELDVSELIPLASERAVVIPEAGKLERFRRIAAESAKQCRRRDIMRIHAVQSPEPLCASANAYLARWCLSTSGAARPLAQIAGGTSGQILACIGPEGGWTERELSGFAIAGFQSVALTQTILRIETAAVAVAAIVMSHAKEKDNQP